MGIAININDVYEIKKRDEGKYIFVDTSQKDVTIYLPLALGFTKFHVKKISNDTNSVFLKPKSNDLIEGVELFEIKNSKLDKMSMKNSIISKEDPLDHYEVVSNNVDRFWLC